MSLFQQISLVVGIVLSVTVGGPTIILLLVAYFRWLVKLIGLDS